MSSELLGNTLRGVFAVYFVALDLGVAEGFRTVEGGMVFRRHESECAPDSEGPCAVFYRFTRAGLARAGEVDWPPL